MKRKNIAVCITGYDWECESRIAEGIYRQCRQLDINLLAFATLLKKPELNINRVLPESVIRGECEIFNLINYDILDGIIILGDSLIDANIVYDIEKNARERNIPCVDISDPNSHAEYNVILSDRIAMEFVMRHLTEDHGFTKINFIGGFPGNIQTEERLAAYKKILTEHDIPIEDERIGYGEFWKKAEECAAKFISDGDIPQAIVCASDTMAFFVMDYLKEKGFRIPQDIVITGFDGVADCERYDPTLTTVRRSFIEAGKTAVDIITDVWEGKKPPKNVCVESQLVKNESCGCGHSGRTSGSFYAMRYADLDRFRFFNTNVVDMSAKFASIKNSADVYKDALFGAEFFGLNKLYICVCSHIEKNQNKLDIDEIRTGYIGLSDTMVSMVRYNHEVPVGTEFPTKDLVPEDFLNGEKAVFYAFSPIYFRDNFIGYLAYETSKISGCGDLFATWQMAISNNAGSFYLNNELEYVVDELEKLYIRDPLTGLYNRRGMNRLVKGLINTAKKKESFVTVICTDIDRLKPINDIYGHEAGDNAITRTAEAIEASVPLDSISTRTGGDEYCIILSHDATFSVENCIDSISQHLEEYNAVSGLPYKVGCSSGFYTSPAAEITTIDKIMKIADDNMYKIKSAKKTNRV